MPASDHWPRVQVFWGLHPEGWRARVPHVGTWHGFMARPTGARLAVPGVPVGGLGGGQPGHICRPSRGARAGTRRVAWRLLSREKGAFFAATPA